MTENKRYVERYAGRTIKKLIGIEDIETGRVCVTIEENIQLLNELNDENAELKKGNEQLKQFKEDVFNKIDMHLRMLPTARDNEFNEEYGDPSLYVGAIYMLETLKKELEE